MKQEITFCDFCDAFGETRQNQFSYNGKKALFDYLEDYEESTDETIELDIIALCCEYSEYDNLSDYIKDYNTDTDKEDYTDEDGCFDVEEFDKAVEKEIENKTTLIKLGKELSEGFIIQCY